MSHVKAILNVHSSGYTRIDKPVEVDLEPGINNLRVVELDASGGTLDAAVPFQIDQRDDGRAVLTFLLRGVAASDAQRRYALVEQDAPQPVTPLIDLTDEVMHQEQASYKITTPAATYLYHKQGAGFASLFDPAGNDWLSYRPYGGSDGKYRGIPNLAHPEQVFHPGGTGCASRIISSGPLKITIASESIDGKWACTWDIFPACARLTVLKVDHPYWFLYEGTPGGKLDEAGDYCVRSNGVRLPLSERWAEAIPAPEWIYFGSATMERVLYLAHHEADEHIDSFWPMEHHMTVFGFGRNGIEKFMTQTPSQFTIGFAEDGDFGAVQRLIDSAVQPLVITRE